ncbi:MAG: hypothetical protein WCA44_04625 [Acidobacteriaceae bacterium]|jgi:hypothetical protein
MRSCGIILIGLFLAVAPALGQQTPPAAHRAPHADTSQRSPVQTARPSAPVESIQHALLEQNSREQQLARMRRAESDDEGRVRPDLYAKGVAQFLRMKVVPLPVVSAPVKPVTHPAPPAK